MFPTGAHAFHPRIPPAPATSKGPIENANRDGSGPDDYRSYNPSVLEKGYLQGVRAAAEGGAGNAAAGMPIAGGLHADAALEQAKKITRAGDERL